MLLMWLVGTLGGIAADEVYRSVLTAGFGVSSISELVTSPEPTENVFEISDTTQQLIVEAEDEADMSANRLDLISCPHTPVPQLFRDVPAIYVGSSKNRLRSAPGLDGTLLDGISPGDRVVIRSDPQCVDNYYWYKILHENREVWAAEASFTTKRYWFVTAFDQSICELPPRFAPSDTAIHDDDESNFVRVRTRPIRTAKETGRNIEHGEIVEVLLGPVCSDSHIWYWIHNEAIGIEGWAAEGFDGEYWFEEPKRFHALGDA